VVPLPMTRLVPEGMVVPPLGVTVPVMTREPEPDKVRAEWCCCCRCRGVDLGNRMLSVLKLTVVRPGLVPT